MKSLYRMVHGLPTLPAVVLTTLSLTGCGSEPPPRESAEPPSNRYLEAIQQAEAAKAQVETRDAGQRPDH